ncbi:unnamed protein product [Chilo suppressalis]|uniref:DM10 domain-containing protein n=1 Tax=Chilo suppressalis TaxID=168631 RepID=A0ABN8B8L5_CHISP|nr:unnamed protein product [Chilo suppressalis]
MARSSLGLVLRYNAPTTQNNEIFEEWLESQGIEVSQPEDLPVDAYTEKERWKNVAPPKKVKSHDDPLLRFLQYDGKVLAFNVVWDDRDSENGELRPYKLLYFLQDDTIAVKELHDDRGGKDPFPLLLKKTKLSKKWNEKPGKTFFFHFLIFQFPNK